MLGPTMTSDRFNIAILKGKGSEVPGLGAVHPKEAALLGSKAIAKRRDDFHRGRWIARRLVSKSLSMEPDGLFVVPDERGVPWAEDEQQGRLPISLSIGHTVGIAAAALVDLPITVGIDVECPLGSPLGVIRDYFTEQEAELCAGVEPIELGWRAAEIWALKEAGLKALGTGLTVPASAIVVEAIDPEIDSYGWQAVDLKLGPTAPALSHRIRAWTRRWHHVVAASSVLVPPGQAGIPRPREPMVWEYGDQQGFH